MSSSVMVLEQGGSIRMQNSKSSISSLNCLKLMLTQTGKLPLKSRSSIPKTEVSNTSNEIGKGNLNDRSPNLGTEPLREKSATSSFKVAVQPERIPLQQLHPSSVGLEAPEPFSQLRKYSPLISKIAEKCAANKPCAMADDESSDTEVDSPRMKEVSLPELTVDTVNMDKKATVNITNNSNVNNDNVHHNNAPHEINKPRKVVVFNFNTTPVHANFIVKLMDEIPPETVLMYDGMPLECLKELSQTAGGVAVILVGRGNKQNFEGQHPREIINMLHRELGDKLEVVHFRSSKTVDDAHNIWGDEVPPKVCITGFYDNIKSTQEDTEEVYFCLYLAGMDLEMCYQFVAEGDWFCDSGYCQFEETEVKKEKEDKPASRAQKENKEKTSSKRGHSNSSTKKPQSSSRMRKAKKPKY